MSLLRLFLVLLSPFAVFAEEEEATTTEAATVELEKFGEIGEHNYEAYLNKAMEGLFWVCFGTNPKSWKEDMEKKKPLFETLSGHEKWGRYPFVYLNMETPDQYEDSGCQKDKTTIVFQTGSLDDEEAPFFRKVLEKADDITEEVVTSFMQDVLDGKIDAVDTLDLDDAKEEAGGVDMNDEEI
jgi:hypothetical protein